MSDSGYRLGSDDVEIVRLREQAARIAEPTAALLAKGGIGPGMRVLDLGSGPGDVSFLLADMVGEQGSVLGIEFDAGQLEVAHRRRDELGLTHVEFRQADARTFDAEEPFDAIVCRLLLMHLPDSADVLAHHLGNLRPGGSFVAVDYDGGGMRALPEVSLWTQAREWLYAGARHSQIDLRVGGRLPALLAGAGYAQVGALGLQPYFTADDRAAARYAADVVRAFAAGIVASGAATEEQLGLDTLAERLHDAAVEVGAVYTMPTIVGGWGRRPV